MPARRRRFHAVAASALGAAALTLLLPLSIMAPTRRALARNTSDTPDGADGDPHGPLPGLGLLPLATRYAAPKRLRAAPVQFGPGPAAWPTASHAAWRPLAGLRWPAYEIR